MNNYAKPNFDTLSDFSDDEDILNDEKKIVFKIQDMKTPFNSINFKNLPTIFFIITAVILTVMLIKFTPRFRSSFALNESYLRKYEIEYFSQTFKDLHEIFKVPVVLSVIILTSIIIILTTLIRQRISVPELSDQKPKNSLTLFSGLVMIVSLSIMFLIPQNTLDFSRSFGFVDNIFNLIYMSSSFLFSYLTFDLIQRISFPEHPADAKYLYFKKLFLIFMSVQLICYDFNFILVSFYNPIIYTEKILLSSMIFTLNLNTISYFFMQAVFIYTLKYDLYYVNLHLEIRPDLEHFVDYEENEVNKYIGKNAI